VNVWLALIVLWTAAPAFAQTNIEEGTRTTHGL
jgi:hypothetical protein